MKRLVVIGLVVAVLLLATAGFAFLQLNNFLHTAVTVGADGEDFTIESGASFRSVSDTLAERGIISDSRYFRLYARWKGKASAVQAGDYLIKQGTTPVQLLEQFSSGDVRLYSFTIIEGWNQWDLLRALGDDPNINASLTVEDWPALLEELQIEFTHPEGLFLPETYRFPRNTSDRKVLARAYAQMQDVLAEEWAARDTGLPLASPYEALILASIVEKETALADERPRIA
ncbi:MAG: endolytic transglycosylase MltG, partial [Gammaproteobacteria bacterium]|nr:endolytic transglycosylase MltG [Gammaproteobacteria bacterium]